ncbi:cobalt/nickel transport system permease protein [Desulfovibrionales bacterium]
MHMADTLISPAVGGACWAVSAGLALWSGQKVQTHLDERRIPFMGVLGAFVFAAQMINFAIPCTGSSDHLSGGLLLSILLGPQAAFLVMASVLTVQALLFADGGLLALGCNILNLGFFTCFVAYPLVYRKQATLNSSPYRHSLAAVLAAVVGLQLGALSVVLETTISGVSDLPFGPFLLLMQPIHLVIGIMEGLVTAAVVATIRHARPDIIAAAIGPTTTPVAPIRLLVLGLGLTAIIISGGLSWFTSNNPDGLEWSIQKVLGKKGLETTGLVHNFLAGIQHKLVLLPGYAMPKSTTNYPAASKTKPSSWNTKSEHNLGQDPPQTVAHADTSLAGLMGGGLTLALTLGLGWLLRTRRAAATSLNCR